MPTFHRHIDGIKNASGQGFIIESNAYVKVPVGGTGDQPGTPEEGMIRYNSDTKALEIFMGDASPTWASLGLGDNPASPEGNFVHRFGDIMYGDLRMADAAGAGAAQGSGISPPPGFISASSGDSRILNSDGIAGEPTYTFDDDLDTGMYRVSDNTLGFSVGGVQQVEMSTTGTIIRGDITVEGTTTVVDSTTLTVADNIIVVNKDEVGAGVTLGSAGLTVERGTESDVDWVFEELFDTWNGSSASGAIQLPAGTTVQRPGSGAGYIRYNSDIDAVEAKTSAGPWTTLASAGGSGSYVDKAGDTMTGTLVITGGILDLHGVLDMNSNRIENLANPNSDDDAMPRLYADSRYLRVDGTNAMSALLVSEDIEPVSTTTYDIGSSSKKYNDVYAVTFNGTATAAQYADLAERYAADKFLEPGTIVVLGGEEEITASSKAYDTRVLGVVSTNPAVMMNSEAGSNETHPYIALAGRVPCKVYGRVKKGDLLVTSSREGVAMVALNREPGTIIGKAIQEWDSNDTGIIEIAVMLG